MRFLSRQGEPVRPSRAVRSTAGHTELLHTPIMASLYKRIPTFAGDSCVAPISYCSQSSVATGVLTMPHWRACHTANLSQCMVWQAHLESTQVKSYAFSFLSALFALCHIYIISLASLLRWQFSPWHTDKSLNYTHMHAS